MNSIYIGSNGAGILERETNGFFLQTCLLACLLAAAGGGERIDVLVCTKNFHYRLLSTLHTNGNTHLPAFCRFNVNKMPMKHLLRPFLH